MVKAVPVGAENTHPEPSSSHMELQENDNMAAFTSFFPKSLVFNSLLPPAFWWPEGYPRGRHDKFVIFA